MDKNRRIRNIVCLALVVFYAAGLLCMILNAFGLGVLLWMLSTVGGLGMLWHIRNKEEKEAFERAQKDAENGDDDQCE